MNSANITHLDDHNFLECFEKIKERVTAMDELEALASFPLGRFLLINRGLNGYWTDYVIKHAQNRQRDLCPMENFLLNCAPTCLATQERFQIFQQQLQKRVCDDVKLASLPCGLMSDLLTLDYANCNNFSLIGIDIDSQSLQLAQEQAKQRGLYNHVSLFELDAWELNLTEQVDVITSNGLNIYEPSRERCIELYQRFFENLKPGGVLITSFLTYPIGPKIEWDLSKVNMKDAMRQKLILGDIVNASWQSFCSSEEVITQLEEAGFENIEIYWDRAKIFPTVVAHKL